MPVPKSEHKCPSCGEHQLYFPDVKGKYGWKDTSKLACYVCDKEFSTKLITTGLLTYSPHEHIFAPGEYGGEYCKTCGANKWFMTLERKSQ